MGEMKAPVRGTEFSPVDDDPFADLATLFEAELAKDDEAYRPHRTAAARLDPPGLDDDFDQAFADAFSRDEGHAPDDRDGRAVPGRPDAPRMSSPSDSSYSSWLSPAPSRSSAGTAGAHLHTTRGPAADTDLDHALRGLSAPARPREGSVFETQSFAPERVVEADAGPTVQTELDEFDQLIASELAMMHDGRRSPSHGSPASYAAAMPGDGDPDQDQSFEAGDPSGAYYDEDERLAKRERPGHGSFRRSMVALGGGVASIAIVAAVGLFLWNGGTAGSSSSGNAEPLLIKADAEPYKIEPKDPGGRTIPNQNKAVYDRVAASEGQPMPSTTQQALLTGAEEPIDLPAEEPPTSYADLPGVEVAGSPGLSAPEDAADEARLVAAASDAATPVSEPVGVLQPRKVRTMVVRPDGTLVAAAEPAAAEASPQGAAAPGLIEVSSPPRQGAAAPVAASADAAPAADAPIAVASAEVPAARTPDVASRLPVPEAAPVEASVPPGAAQQQVAAVSPVDATGGIAPTTPSAPAPKGTYFVQISSQPSEALAQQSLRNLTGRYSSQIAGRSVGIQSADIPGKGTFYRVRVAAGSKDEASALCTQLKSAGGNCFVAR
ncbi:SPOR domain-containing protein [Aureimonas sp. SA4125]|uniref:SPOR domain-containing protein n=1 Tax=Aureimonas sp. SA4125 TaxID=2826993 RepID=UPI001CC6F6B1|nr:SPOR domain-containing protein [Aureimonas sp. SA4125]